MASRNDVNRSWTKGSHRRAKAVEASMHARPPGVGGSPFASMVKWNGAAVCGEWFSNSI